MTKVKSTETGKQKPVLFSHHHSIYSIILLDNHAHRQGRVLCSSMAMVMLCDHQVTASTNGHAL